jgi:hypothetical protein
MKTIAGVLITAALVFGSGCATSDWIERTLVTVDVTGNWHGSLQGGNQSTGFLWFEIEQHGSAVKGAVQVNATGWARQAYGSTTARPITGTVAGDVFRFKEVNGKLEGEVRVNGDEMTGEMWMSGLWPISLRRIDPSSANPPTR